MIVRHSNSCLLTHLLWWKSFKSAACRTEPTVGLDAWIHAFCVTSRITASCPVIIDYSPWIIKRFKSRTCPQCCIHLSAAHSALSKLITGMKIPSYRKRVTTLPCEIKIRMLYMYVLVTAESVLLNDESVNLWWISILASFILSSIYRLVGMMLLCFRCMRMLNAILTFLKIAGRYNTAARSLMRPFWFAVEIKRM